MAKNTTQAQRAAGASDAAISASKTHSKFLEQLRPGGPWVLTAIMPDGPTETITARDEKDVDAFVRRSNGKKNIYFSVNPTRKAMTSKAAKTDIAAIEYVLADLDPRDDETPEAAKERYLQELDTRQPKPTAIIDSGNGIQALWKLAEPIALAEPVIVRDEKGKTKKLFPPETAAIIADAEARTAALMEGLGSVAGTQNIDRILRLPGTTNLPNKKKVKAGRVACPATLIKFDGATSKLEDFPVAASPKDGQDQAKSVKSEKTNASKIDWTKVPEHAGWLQTVADLPSNFNGKGKIIVAHSGALEDLNADLKWEGLIKKGYGSWSDVSLALAAIFKADGRFTLEQIAAALTCDLECNQHVTRIMDTDKKLRAVERLISRSYEPAKQRFAGALQWRECYKDGTPVASLYNARLAIGALGIDCSHDIFHNKLLCGFHGDGVQHEIQAVEGEVTDYAVLRLRQMISARFGFDPTSALTRDAMTSLALEHCFDPVCDMLAKAEAEYDGVERLDACAVKYFHCPDTPLNRAGIRKQAIAAVRRARHPGCKHDVIVVLESKEGWGKSAAIRTLAGSENYSDASILGKGGKEVQEELAGVWMHENADLAGLRKAEVETVKAFASRQVDSARPAYGHFLVRQPRHSVEWGTTNSSEYLQSQTGNRRFLPMTVLGPIDIELLKRDRLQLLGEAAKYETAGESITIDEALWPDAGAEQEKRRVKDPWEDIVADMPTHWYEGSLHGRVTTVHLDEAALEPKDKDENGKPQFYKRVIHQEPDLEVVSSADVLTFVLGVPVAQQHNGHAMRLAQVMKHTGWDRGTDGRVTINGKQVRGYFRHKDQSVPNIIDGAPKRKRLRTV